MLSIVIPAKNELSGLTQVIPELKTRYPNAEIIVVDDGSTDGTSDYLLHFELKVIKHPTSQGNGAAIKSGIRAASGEWILCMDGDGQHKVDDIEAMLEHSRNGYDMVIGARVKGSHANLARGFANGVYNRFASWVSGNQIPDLTSGFRLFRANIGKQFEPLLPNGFSYPTTITMASLRAGYSILFHPIKAEKRIGDSHIRPIKDGLRFLLIIFKVGTLYSPFRIFFPLSAAIFFIGLAYYIYTLSHFDRLTNMSVLLFITSVLIFCMGLISEQITSLMYMQIGNKNEGKKRQH